MDTAPNSRDSAPQEAQNAMGELSELPSFDEHMASMEPAPHLTPAPARETAAPSFEPAPDLTPTPAPTTTAPSFGPAPHLTPGPEPNKFTMAE